MPERGALEQERPPHRLEQIDDRRVPGQSREALGLRPRAASLRRTTGRERDEDAHRRRHGQKDGEREEVLGLRDRERVERGREVPVREQERRDRRRERGPDPADGRDDDDDEQVEQEHARQPQLVPELREDERERREGDRGSDGAGDDAVARESGGAPPLDPGSELSLARVADHVDVDVLSGGADHSVDHGALRELPPARSPRRAHHDPRRVDGACRAHERLRDVVAHDLAEGAAEALDERPLTGERVGCGRREAVLGLNVHADQVALRPLRHARRTPDETVSVLGAGQGDDDSLARLPGALDPVQPAVLLECLVHTVGHPEQCELAEGAEVALAEVVAERGVDPLGGIDVAVCHPSA